MIKFLMMVVLLSVALAFVKAFFRNLGRPPAEKKPGQYEKVACLLSPAERSFFAVLEQAVGGHFRLFTKVRVADILRVKNGVSGGARQSAFNAISSKHVDFLACRPDDLSIAFAIELDDASHQREGARQRDEVKDSALATGGVPVFRFTARRAYVVQEIKDALFAKS